MRELRTTIRLRFDRGPRSIAMRLGIASIECASDEQTHAPSTQWEKRTLTLREWPCKRG